MARRVRPGTTKVSGLTPMNVAALRTAVQTRGWVGVTITPTTATWGCPPGQALGLVLDAIRHPRDGQDTRSLHAVKRKLEKQLRPGVEPSLPTPDPPKASKRLLPSACDHAQREGTQQLAGTRVKCLCCGLTYDADPTVDRLMRQRPARPSQAGRKTATVAQDPPRPAAPQKAAQPGYLVAAHGDSFLVVDVAGSAVMATCSRMSDADRIVSALNRKDPQR